MSSFEKIYRVTFDDVGSNLKMTNIALMRYLVDCAGLHSESLGYGISQSKETHVGFLLTGWKIKVLNRPILLDNLRIRTWPETFNHSVSIRNFEIYMDDKIVALASSKWVLVDPKDHSIGHITEDLTNAFSPEKKKVFDEPIEKLNVPEKIDRAYEYEIKRRDIDSYNHVNNIKYLEFTLDLLDKSDSSDEDAYSEVIVNYKHECLLGNVVSCSYTKQADNSCIISIQNKDKSRLYAIIKLKK